MKRLLCIVLEDCSSCAYNKWKYSTCGKNDGQHCMKVGGDAVIVTDSELAESGGMYPPIPEFCPLPIDDEEKNV